MAGLPRAELIGLMLGKPLGDAAGPPAPVAAPAGLPLLRAANLGRRPGAGVSVEVRAGEVVGLAGLLGSGRSTVLRALFGLDPLPEGTVEVAGHALNPRSPADAMNAGVGFLPEDRRAEGVVPEMSVRENLTLAALPMLTRFGVVDRRRQAEVVEKFMARLRIKAVPGQAIRELSGGNQQKVLLARWLCREPQLLLLDEPTRGIDVGARGEIQALVRELADAGLGVLLASSELAELVEACGRVVVLRDGQGVAELSGAGVAEGPILRAMAGGVPNLAEGKS